MIPYLQAAQMLSSGKFNSAGNLLWATFYGGTEEDYALGTCTDHNNNIYITGVTASTDGIATPGAHQESFGGGDIGRQGDAFIAKFTIDGYLAWGTYFGGSGYDAGLAIVCDTNNFIYVCGETGSTDSIATVGTYSNILPTTTPGIQDGFLTKFDSGGEQIWGTYYGGSGGDEPYALVLDGADNIYIAGSTSSKNGIATPGAYHAVYDSMGDGFLAKFSNAGSLLWGTYYGSTGEDDIYGICVDKNSDVYISGGTNSTDSIATPGAYQTIYGGGTDDAFIAKFSPNDSLLWATYYGGESQERCSAITYDTLDNCIYITGQTGSETNIATPGAYQYIINAGLYDGFIAKLSVTGSILAGTYYGGTDADDPVAITHDQAGAIYIAGDTKSTDGIATAGSYNSFYEGDFDGFLAKFDSLTGPVAVNNVNFPLSRLIVYPDPANTHCTIVFPKQEKGMAEITLTAMGGRIVKRISAYTTSPVDLEFDLATGVYFLHAVTAGHTYEQMIDIERK